METALTPPAPHQVRRVQEDVGLRGRAARVRAALRRLRRCGRLRTALHLHRRRALLGARRAVAAAAAAGAHTGSAGGPVAVEGAAAGVAARGAALPALEELDRLAGGRVDRGWEAARGFSGRGQGSCWRSRLKQRLASKQHPEAGPKADTTSHQQAPKQEGGPCPPWRARRRSRAQRP
jgi:hypothetical protein